MGKTFSNEVITNLSLEALACVSRVFVQQESNRDDREYAISQNVKATVTRGLCTKR